VKAQHTEAGLPSSLAPHLSEGGYIHPPLQNGLCENDHRRPSRPARAPSALWSASWADQIGPGEVRFSQRAARFSALVNSMADSATASQGSAGLMADFSSPRSKSPMIFGAISGASSALLPCSTGPALGTIHADRAVFPAAPDLLPIWRSLAGESGSAVAASEGISPKGIRWVSSRKHFAAGGVHDLPRARSMNEMAGLLKK